MGAMTLFLAVAALGLSIWAIVKLYQKPIKAVLTALPPLESPFSEERTGTEKQLIFRPNGGDFAGNVIKSANTYTTWAALMDVLGNNDGMVEILFDSTPEEPIEIPAGTYDMTNAYWSCANKLFLPTKDLTTSPHTSAAAQRVEVVLEDGVILQNLTKITGPMTVRCFNTSDPNMILDKEGVRFELLNGAALVGSSSTTDFNTKPFVQFKKLTDASMHLGNDTALVRGANNTPLVEILGATAGSTFAVTIDGALVGRDEFTAEATVTMLFYFTGLRKTSTAVTVLDYPIARTVSAQLNAVSASATIKAYDLNPSIKVVKGTVTTAPGSLVLANTGFKVHDQYVTSANVWSRATAIDATTGAVTWTASAV